MQNDITPITSTPQPENSTQLPPPTTPPKQLLSKMTAVESL